jgi:hypothetical protein
VEQYPDDLDGRILTQIAQTGFDMSKPVEFEFFVDSPNEDASMNIEEVLKSGGFTTEVYFDEGELKPGEKMTEENSEYWPSWSVYVYVKMIPNYDKVMFIQEQLDTLSIPFNGKSDGWQIKIEPRT